MARVRPRSRRGQFLLPLKRRGGAHKGAGRPPKGPRSSERHKTRESFLASEPVHVVTRVKPDVGTLRCKNLYLSIREATITALKHEDFRIVHLSIQGTHVHLIVEAAGKEALARGMQGFGISAAKQVNRALVTNGKRRKGGVFVDRYHATVLRSPRAVRNCISYVLNNWRHRGEDKKRFARRWKVDPFSSGVAFHGWRESQGYTWLAHLPRGYMRLVVWLPQTWLLRVGWKQKHGRISAFEVPG